MRPSWRSFSSVMRAISRRTPSKADSTTALGVSSMMKSTPVRFSRARMLRPSRPMMRPFMSSDGSWTTETVVSAAWLAAGRRIATERRRGARRREALHRDREDRAHPALGVALGLLLDLADDPRRVVARLVLDVLEQRLLGLAGRQPRDALQRARVLLVHAVELVALLLEPSRESFQLALAARQLLRAALELVRAAVERALERLRSFRAARQLLLALAQSSLAGRLLRRAVDGRDRPAAIERGGRDDAPCQDDRRDHEFHCRVLSSPAPRKRPAHCSAGSWSDG